MTVAKIITNKIESVEYLFREMILNFNIVLVEVDNIMTEKLKLIKERIIHPSIIEDSHI